MQDLPKNERLCGHVRIGQLFENGARGISHTTLARALANPEGKTRVAVAAGRKLGKAVLRTRLKRRLRAAYRVQKHTLPEGFDYVLVAKRGLAEAPWRNVMQDVAKAVRQAAREASGPRRHGQSPYGRGADPSPGCLSS